MAQEFKIARYHNWGYHAGCGPEFGQVLYTIIGNKCIFTALGYDFTSTINACEAIVEEIVRLEGCDIHDFEFYDLQTHVMYDSKVPGKFEIDNIVVHEEPVEEEIADMLREAQGDTIIKGSHHWTPGWNPAKFDPSIIELFRACIGHPNQKRTTEEALVEIAKAYNLVLTIPELN